MAANNEQQLADHLFLCALHPPNVLLVFHFLLSWLSIIFHVTLVCSEQPHKTSWQDLLLHITLGDPSALGSFPAVRTHLVIFFFLHCINFFIWIVCFSEWGPHSSLAYLSYHVVISFSRSLSNSNSQKQRKVTPVTQPYIATGNTCTVSD